MTSTHQPQHARQPRRTTIASWAGGLPLHLAAVVNHMADHLLLDEAMHTTADEILPLTGLVKLRLITETAIAAETTALRQQPNPWRWNDIAAALGIDTPTARARYQQAQDRPLAQLEDRLDDDIRSLAERVTSASTDEQQVLAKAGLLG